MSARLLALCLLAPIAIVTARMILEGRAAMAEAEQLADRTDADSIAKHIAALGRAARRPAPFGSADRARTQLAELGRSGTRGAYEELRAAILATRWLFTPAPALLEEANRALATKGNATYAELSATHEPSRGYSLLAIVGLVAFIAAVARLLTQGSRRAAMFALASLAIFLVALWRA